ncbi:pyridoxamine 5'-phosphate oxidase family protein [Mucilaginibacter sp. RS28]|uniref:Pyridoxamine 5'-phosphate oxidase family protein n=1 Tax=Mucilaginibacter straminoryzae TaxID=2932774 RepID=A0A9X1X4Y8_9SPHI|nr:pyridoxamine 5'-phosphate oxidase family protein [Mucilaginibacter straminoryzae]MCJ8209683.1 pyridoxamine 5'-phosphate oxidase family protein [Mucilaginibacter straminoryzae]
MEYQDELKRLENIEKLRGMIDKIKTAMLTTYSATEGFHSRPMGTLLLDAEGALWFFTNEYSTKVAEISLDNKVSVTYSDVANHVYISLTGTASLVDDRTKMQELWTPYVEVFFPQGINDPALTLMKIDTESAEYWDSSASKIVVLFKMLKAAVLGKTYQPGEHDKVDL